MHSSRNLSLHSEDSLQGDLVGQIEADNLIHEEGSRISWCLNQLFLWKQRDCTRSFLIQCFFNPSWSYLVIEIILWPFREPLLFVGFCLCYRPHFRERKKKKTKQCFTSLHKIVIKPNVWISFPLVSLFTNKQSSACLQPPATRFSYGKSF